MLMYFASSTFFSLNKSNTLGVFDNSQNILGHWLYGINFKVFNPDVIQDCESVREVLKSSHFKEQIRQ